MYDRYDERLDYGYYHCKRANSQVPSGTAIAISVSTSAFPCAGIVVAFDAYISYPAANALPRVGSFAFALSFFMRSDGTEEDIVDWVSASSVTVLCDVLVRFASGECGDVGGTMVDVDILVVRKLN